MSPGPLDMIESVRAHHRAYERGDWDAALAVVSPELEFVWVQAGPGSGTYSGHEGIRSSMGEWIRAWERGSIAIRLDLLIVSGSTVTVRGAHLARGRSSGVEVSLPLGQVWSFGDDGLATRIVTGDAEAVDAPLPAHVQAFLDHQPERLFELVIDLGDRIVAQAPRHGIGSWWFRDGEVVRVRWFESLDAALSVTD